MSLNASRPLASVLPRSGARPSHSSAQASPPRHARSPVREPLHRSVSGVAGTGHGGNHLGPMVSAAGSRSLYPPLPSPIHNEPKAKVTSKSKGTSRVLEALERDEDVFAFRKTMKALSIEDDAALPVVKNSRKNIATVQTAMPMSGEGSALLHPVFLKTSTASADAPKSAKSRARSNKTAAAPSTSRSTSSPSAVAPDITSTTITATTTKRATKASTKGSANNKAKEKTEEPSQPLAAYSYRSYGDPHPVRVYTRSEDEANDMVLMLKGPLGFDLEWRPSFFRGPERPTAVVQLCDSKTILIVQISQMKRFPQKLMEIIEDPERVKMGANIRNDGVKLWRDYGIRARGLVELGAFARRADPTFPYNRQVVALARVVAFYENKELKKGVERTSDWEGKLTDEMLEYAANDAHCALMVYNRLLALANTSGRVLPPTASAYTADLYAEYLAGKLAGSTSAQGQAQGGSSTAPRMATQASNSSTMSTLTTATDVSNATCSSRTAASTMTTATSWASGRTAESGPSPQYLRAYKLWRARLSSASDGMLSVQALGVICAELSTRGRASPLKESTVISYIISALQADSSLQFDVVCLKELVQMDASSWVRHRDWMLKTEAKARQSAL